MDRRALISLPLLLLDARPVLASVALGAAQGPVILTVGGAIRRTNAGAAAQLDDAMLAALPQHGFTTATPWYDQRRSFRGPRLSDVLALVDAQGRTLSVTSLDDSQARIPVSDALEYPVILTREIDGRRLTVRDRGPLFLVYPYDSHRELLSGRYFARSLSQLTSIEVER